MVDGELRGSNPLPSGLNGESRANHLQLPITPAEWTLLQHRCLVARSHSCHSHSAGVMILVSPKRHTGVSSALIRGCSSGVPHWVLMVAGTETGMAVRFGVRHPSNRLLGTVRLRISLRIHHHLWRLTALAQATHDLLSTPINNGPRSWPGILIARRLLLPAWRSRPRSAQQLCPGHPRADSPRLAMPSGFEFPL